jgi:hypothetical protein
MAIPSSPLAGNPAYYSVRLEESAVTYRTVHLYENEPPVELIGRYVSKIPCFSGRLDTTNAVAGLTLL